MFTDLFLLLLLLLLLLLFLLLLLLLLSPSVFIRYQLTVPGGKEIDKQHDTTPAVLPAVLTCDVHS